MIDKFEPPTTDESRRFLISFLFNGSMSPGLKECVWRAYLDLSRTVHGMGKHCHSKTLKSSTHKLMERLLKKATDRTSAWDQVSYDKWHQIQCTRICRFHAKSGFASFCVGQAQKWLNMSVKYALTLNSVGMLPFEHADAMRRVAHIPLDGNMLIVLRSYGSPNLGCAWSRVRDYKTYFDYQRWFRKWCEASIPLDAEFHLWIKEAKQR